MIKSLSLLTIVIVAIAVSLTFGRTNHIGYSGAPGSNGSCASTCHGSSGGAIEIIGFPSEYLAEETYEITISHDGGYSIAQFNGSCRAGDGSENSGELSAGINTETYNTSGETNGIHFASSNQDSGTFHWTAPASGAGEVKLYIAGSQGGFSGPNSDIVLSATEQVSGIEEHSEIPDLFKDISNYPNPFNISTVIDFYYNYEKPSNVRFGIYSLAGHIIYERYIYCSQEGIYHLTWNGLNEQSIEVPSGIYFYRLESIYGVTTNKMVLQK